MHSLLVFLGIDDVTGPWYAFWSGFGGDLGEFAIAFGIIRGLMKLRYQRDKHHQQMKDHIDYQFKKLRQEDVTNG